jgi:hypothetical protein
VRPVWEHCPKKWWTEPDWQAWEKAGRPRVPRHLDLRTPLEVEQETEQRIGTKLPVPPPGPQSAVTTLFPKPRRREAASARSRAVDRLIEEHVGFRSS